VSVATNHLDCHHDAQACRTCFKSAIFALPLAGASLKNLSEWRVVEPEVAGSVHISQQVQPLAKAEGLLTGTSHSDIESYQATMEDWVLENDDDLYQSRVQGQEENVVVKYLSWRTCMSLHGHRCDEGGSYCPDARDIKVPQETENWERGPDGSPKHIEITYCW
jgi:hypothetical protein